MLNSVKDALTSRAALTFANSQFTRYGIVQELRIDSRQKTVDLTCLLHGETVPIVVKAENYVVESMGDKKFLQVTRFSCARPWVQNLLVDFGQGRRIELPPWAAAAL